MILPPQGLRASANDLANWNWKVVHRRLSRNASASSLCRSSCLTYLRRLGYPRPKGSGMARKPLNQVWKGMDRGDAIWPIVAS